MNYSIFRFTLNMHNHRSQAMVKVFQGDTAVKLIIALTDGGNVYKIREGNVATLTGTKADGSKITHSCTITDNTIIYLFDEETADTAGLVTCEITLYDSKGGIITAPKFTIDVDEKEVSGSEPISEYSATAIATVMGAAAKELEREASEEARKANETDRQESYTNAINVANEAKQTANNANGKSDSALSFSTLANSTANSANGKSDNAVATANDAKEVANTANSTAAEAKATAEATQASFKSIKISYNNQNGEFTLSYTDEKGEQHTELVDLSLESSIVEITESKNASDQPILILKLASGITTTILLDDIFNGFVQKRNDRYTVYGIDGTGANVTIPVDVNSGSVVRRNASGMIEISKDASNANEAVRYGQLNKVKDQLDTLEQQHNTDVEGIWHEFSNLTDSGYGLIPELDQKKADKSAVESISKEVTDHNRRIEQLESLSLEYIEDTSIWHTKDVPNNVGKKALVDMIGGMSHTSNNRLPFPYPNMYDNEQNGVSVTYNKDGSITLNGVLKNPSQVSIVLFENYDSPLCVNGYFTIGVDLPENCSFLCHPELVDEGLFDSPEQYDYPQEVKSSLMDKFNYLLTAFIATQGDVIFDNYTFYPMFSEGEALPYEPYIAGIKHAKVKAIRAMVDGEVLSSVEVPKEIYDRADWGLGVPNKIYNFIDLNNDTYLSKCAICTFDGSEDWKEKPATGKIRFMTNLTGYASPYIESTKTATPAVANYYTSVSASKNLNQHNKSYAFGANSFFVFDKDIQDLNSWIEHLKNNPLTVVYEKADVDYVKLDNFPQEAKALVMDTSKGKLVAENDENLPAPSTITYITHRGL